MYNVTYDDCMTLGSGIASYGMTHFMYDSYQISSELKINFNTTKARTLTYIDDKLRNDLSWMLDVSVKIMSKP